MEFDPASAETQRCMLEIAQAAADLSAADNAVVRVLFGDVLRVIASVGLDIRRELDVSLTLKTDVVARSLREKRPQIVVDAGTHDEQTG